MMWKSKDWYCTLFCPKYCATSGAAPNSASAATIPPMRRMTVILSTALGCARREHRGVAPQALELIELPQFRMKNVHHEIHVVEQHPPTLSQPFYVMLHDAARLERGHQVLRHPPHVRIRRSRHDHEKICRGGQATQVEHHRVDAFAVDERRGHELQRRQRIAAGSPRRRCADGAAARGRGA